MWRNPRFFPFALFLQRNEKTNKTFWINFSPLFVRSVLFVMTMSRSRRQKKWDLAFRWDEKILRIKRFEIFVYVTEAEAKKIFSFSSFKQTQSRTVFWFISFIILSDPWWCLLPSNDDFHCLGEKKRLQATQPYNTVPLKWQWCRFFNIHHLHSISKSFVVFRIPSDSLLQCIIAFK